MPRIKYETAAGDGLEQTRFCVSAQPCPFLANAFAELVLRFGRERCELLLNEAQTRQVVEDVGNHVSDLGVLCFRRGGECGLRECVRQYGLEFHQLFTLAPRILLWREHPLAGCESVTFQALRPYPMVCFGEEGGRSPDPVEELFACGAVDKRITLGDRAALLPLMSGLGGYALSTDGFPQSLLDDSLVSVPLAEEETMCVGYVLNPGQVLSRLEELFIGILMRRSAAGD